MSNDQKTEKTEKTAEQDQAIALAKAQHLPSANEPLGSVVGEAPELPPLVLSDISPDTMVVGTGTFTLTVTGSGFTPETVVVFNDADMPTTFVSPTELTADCPVEAAPMVADVEVHRGEDMSDVVTFEFTVAATMSREKREPVRKPKKETPISRRMKRK